MAEVNDRVFFWFTTVAGGLVLLGCVLPTFEIGLGASIGAGDDQHSYEFNRTLHALTYTEPGALVFVFVGVVLVASGILGLLRGGVRVVAPLVAAVIVVGLVQTISTSDYFQWDDVGVFSCQAELETCIGFLAPAVHDLRADILRRPIAREREFLGPEEHEYRTRGLVGWQLIAWPIALFSLVAWFRMIVLVMGRPRASLLILAAIALLILAALVLRALANLAE